MRILVCTNAYPPSFVGGAELVAHALAREWDAQGHDVAVFAGNPRSEAERHSLSSDTFEGVVVHRIATTANDYDISLPEPVKGEVEAHFLDVVESFGPDVVHCHNLTGLSLRIPILAAEHGSRVFLTLHDYWGFCFRNTLLRGDGQPCDDMGACAECLFPGEDREVKRLELRMRRDLVNLAFDHVERFVAPSSHLASLYIEAGLEPGRIEVIPNGMDIERFRPKAATSPAGSLQILYVGHLGPHKGMHVAIQALAIAGPQIVLHVVGEGSEIDRLQALALRLGVRERVRFRGKFQPAAIDALYHEADAVILPSVWQENQPVCLMEAMACGLPVLASDIGGIPAMITDGHEGFLFPAGDAQAIAKAMDRLARSPELRARMGARGRERADGRTYTKQALQMMTVFSAGSKTALAPVLRHPIAAIQGGGEGQIRPRLRFWLSRSRHYAVPEEWLTKALVARVDTILRAGNRTVREYLLQTVLGVVNLAPLPRWLGAAIRRRMLRNPSH